MPFTDDESRYAPKKLKLITVTITIGLLLFTLDAAAAWLANPLPPKACSFSEDFAIFVLLKNKIIILALAGVF